MAIEAREQSLAIPVLDRPEAPYHGTGTALEEGARQAHHPLTAKNLAACALTGGEHHDLAVHLEPENLADIEMPVLSTAGSEEDRRALRVLSFAQ